MNSNIIMCKEAFEKEIKKTWIRLISAISKKGGQLL
ncbi:hypothetical protein SAMN05421784_13731 [Xenorhabdus koppenhoeferi]|uniref:Uncharacterized protein n=1 Tax=Xenorhabdus koppenhoeferi TaxID=351659 RepID=A0A1I7JR71_9GAMM|nr:hypothetical protein SAMN05421784_13731 [Xenorhabdus koppenhoeferi]